MAVAWASSSWFAIRGRGRTRTWTTAERGRGQAAVRRRLRGDYADDDLPKARARLRQHNTRSVKLGESSIAMEASLLTGVIMSTRALEDLDDLGYRIGRWFAVRIERREACAVPGTRMLEGIDDRQRLLAARHICRLLAGRLFLTPDPEQVVVDLEREPEVPAERSVATDDVFVVRRQERPGLDRGGDERRRLAADHVEVQLDGPHLVRLARCDVDVLALAQRDARRVVQAHETEDLVVAEAHVGQPMQGDAAQAEQHVPGVDCLRDSVQAPERGSMPSLPVAILDVVVHEAEVVAELDGRRTGQRSAVVTGDRGVGQEAQERPHPLARQAVGAIKAKVVAALLVDADRRGVSVADEAEDLRFGVRDELGEVELRGSGGHRGGSVALPDQTCEVQVACCAGDLSARCRPDSVVLPSESCPLHVAMPPMPSSCRGSTTARRIGS